MGWLYVLIGGIFEIGWAVGLKYTQGFTAPVPSLLTAVCLVVSFYYFAKSMKALPVGTAYAVFTGIGSAGTVIVGMLFMNEPVTFWRLFFILLLLGAIIGLKKISPDEEPSPPPQQQQLPNQGGV